MSIQLVNNNYKIIVNLVEDYLYIKVTNCILLTSYDVEILSYDITSEYIKTIENLWDILKRSFKMMDKLYINILNPAFAGKRPDIKQFNENNDDYIVLKLLENNDNIVLTIYYHIVIKFEYNITLTKMKSDISMHDPHGSCIEISDDFDKKNKEIMELSKKLLDHEQKLNILMDFCGNMQCIVAIARPQSKIIQCECRSKILTFDEYMQCCGIELCTNFANFYNLENLTISTYINNKLLISNKSLKILTILPGYDGTNGFSIIPEINANKLKGLLFKNCRTILGKDTLLNQLIHHPNIENIDLVFDNSPYFNINIEHYKLIGLKSVTVR